METQSRHVRPTLSSSSPRSRSRCSAWLESAPFSAGFRPRSEIRVRQAHRWLRRRGSRGAARAPQASRAKTGRAPEAEIRRPGSDPPSGGRASSACPGRGPRFARECAVIEEVREVEKAGTASGAGAVGGAVVGGVLGHQMGGGRGKDVATVLGVLAAVLPETRSRRTRKRPWSTNRRPLRGRHRACSPRQRPRAGAAATKSESSTR